MDIMPVTGWRYGYSRTKPKHAENSVHMTCMTLQDFSYFLAHIINSEQRMKSTPASYDSGSAYAPDAHQLVENVGLSPDRWDDPIETFMACLSEPEYYNDLLIQHGRVNRDHTMRYVTGAFSRTQSYKSKMQYATTR